MIAFRTVYRAPSSVALGLLTFLVLSTFYLWSSQVLVVTAHGITWLWQPLFVLAAVIMAALFGMLLPLEVYAFRLAATTSVQAGGTALGALLGTASMTCCAPVVVPSILSALGASGTSILSVNGQLNRFWLPLATLSTILLVYALVSVSNSLRVTCAMPAPEVLSNARPKGVPTLRS